MVNHYYVGIVVLDLLVLKKIHRHIVTCNDSISIESTYLSTSWTLHMCWHDGAIHSQKKITHHYLAT